MENKQDKRYHSDYIEQDIELEKQMALGCFLCGEMRIIGEMQYVHKENTLYNSSVRKLCEKCIHFYEEAVNNPKIVEVFKDFKLQLTYYPNL